MAYRQLPDGRWIVYYKDKETGKCIREYFGRGPDAKEAARARNAALGFGRRAPAKKHTGPLFGALAKIYAQTKHFSDNSRKHLKIRLNVNILPYFAHRRAESLTFQDLDNYIVHRRNSVRILKNGRKVVGVKMSTITRELSDIKAILNYAAKRRPPLITSNPVRDYDKPGDIDMYMFKPPTEKEIGAIMAHASPHLARAITLSYYLGLRPGAVELLTLTWQAVNLDTRIITITPAQKGKAPKRIRDVPIHQGLYDELVLWRKEDQKKGHLVNYRGKPIKKLQTTWENTLKRAGINRRLRPYDLRHYFVTKALEDGADIKALAEVVGSRPETLMRFYQHVTKQVHRDTVARIPVMPSGPNRTKKAKKKPATRPALNN